MKFRIAICAAACCAALQTTVGRADQVPMIPQTGKIDGGFLYWSIGGSVQRSSVPTWSAPAFFGAATGTSAFTSKPWVTSAGPSATIGYVFDDMPFGSRPRIEAALSYSTMGQDDERQNPAVGPGYNAFLINGVPNFGFNPGDQFILRLRTKFEGGDAAVRFRTDFHITPAITLSPGLGIVAGGSMLKYDYTVNQLQAPGFVVKATHLVGEKILSGRIGSQAVLDATWRVNDAFSINAGVDAQVYLQRSRLKAIDCYSGFYVGDGCDGLSGRALLSTSDNKIGGSIGASLGFTYNWGWAELSLSGFGRRVFNAAGVRNPSFADPSPASLRYESTWNYGGFVQVTFPLANLMH